MARDLTPASAQVGPAAQRQLAAAASDYIVVKNGAVVEQIAAQGVEAARTIQARQDGVLYRKVGNQPWAI